MPAPATVLSAPRRPKATPWAIRAGAALLASSFAHLILAAAAGAILSRGSPRGADNRTERTAALEEAVEIDVGAIAEVDELPGSTNGFSAGSSRPASGRGVGPPGRVLQTPPRRDPAPGAALSALSAPSSSLASLAPFRFVLGMAAGTSANRPEPATSAGTPAGPRETSGGAAATDHASGGDALPEQSVNVPARLVTSPPLAYPPAARAAEIEVDLPFEIVVDVSGRVRATRGLIRAGYGLDEAALEALRGYRFSPATRDGHPVPVRMRWTVQFRLR